MSQTVPKNKIIVIYRSNLNGLGCVRTLGACGVCPHGIHVVNEKDIVTCSRYWREVDHVPTREDALRLLEEKYGHESEKPVVISVDDGITQLLDKNYDRLSQLFYLPSFGGVQGKLDYYADKLHQLELREALGGLRMMGGYVVERESFGTYLPGESEYPVMVKPLESSKGGKHMEICRTAEKYRAFMEKITAWEPPIPRMLVQAYVEKRVEYVAFGAICPNRHLISYTVLRNVRQFPEGFGVGCYSEILTEGAAVEYAAGIFEGLCKLGYDGPVDIEIFEDLTKGGFLVNEFNWRCGGRNFVALYTGIYSNYWWAMCKVVPDFQIPVRVVNDKHGFTIKGECDIFSAKHGLVGKWQWLKQWFGAESHSLIFWRDPLPVFKDFFYVIGSWIRGLWKHVVH